MKAWVGAGMKWVRIRCELGVLGGKQGIEMGGDERRYVMICLKSYRYHHRGTGINKKCLGNLLSRNGADLSELEPQYARR